MPSGISLAKSFQAYQRLGNHIRRSRVNAGLSQMQLANRVCICHDTMSRIERGVCRTEILVILEIAEILDQDVVVWLKD